MIKLQCKCGHTLSLPDKLSGKKIKCKRCNKVLRVPIGRAPPTAQPEKTSSDPEFLVQGSRPCSSCGQMYPPTVVICVTCGLNIDSGAMLYASLEEAPAPKRRGLLGGGGGSSGGGDDGGESWFQKLLAKLGLGGKG